MSSKFTKHLEPALRHGITRRDALHLGIPAFLGLGLVDLLRNRLIAKDTRVARAKSCILLWLDGGPSHLETWDPKPDAPLEVRGPFSSISTNVSGIEISELLSETAKQADRFAIIRSLTSPLGEHGLAHQYVLTGYPPSPVLRYPSFGSVLNHLRPGDSILPGHVAIPESRGAGAGYLGAAFEAFATGGDPSRDDFQVKDLDFFPGIDRLRLERRREYLNQFDAAQREFESLDRTGDDPFNQAYRLVTSAETKKAFDLSEETASVRERYGPRMFGQSCLLARRLVERGVPFITVVNQGWDTHEDLVLQLKLGYSAAKVGVGLIPTFDQAFSALLSDLSQRGLLEETLVIAIGEFGRTPKLNTRGGRDHWPRVFSAVLAGGGVPGGQVIGSSDRVGESPRDNPITPNDLARTLYTLLGVDPDHELQTPDGRPVPVNQGGQVIRELMST